MIKKCVICGKEFQVITNKKCCSEDCTKLRLKEKYKQRRFKYRKNMRKAANKYRKNHPEYKEYNRIRNRKIKLEVLTHYGGNPPKCACCGEIIYEFLTIDHINNDGREHRKQIKMVGGTKFYRWLKRNNFPEGFQVLCFNCNCGKEINKGVCPHKSKNVFLDRNP